jgi:hypothetical protein
MSYVVLYAAGPGPNLRTYYNKRILGDEGADLASASSVAFERERYAVHAIPTVETKG